MLLRSALGAAPLAVCAAAAAVTLPGLPHSASVALSSSRAGARPVSLTLQLRYDMQCGYPGRGPLLVSLPPAEVVPLAIAPASLLVDGQPALGVTIAGHQLRVDLAPPPQVMCDVIGPGRLALVVEASADLGNPRASGSYALNATIAGQTFAARFAVHPA